MNEDLEIIFDLAKDSMSNAISHLEKKLLNIRAGKANPNMLTNVFVDYYGTSTPISQVANVNTPDGRTLIIQPWDKTMLPEIEKGIEVANLGFNPMNNGENIITLGDFSVMDISNSILWNTDSPEIQLLPNNSSMNANIIYSNIEEIDGFENNINISSDPLFVDAMNNNFQLQQGSPCIDAGTAYFEWDNYWNWYYDLQLIIEENEYYGSAPDMGAYEWEPNSETQPEMLMLMEVLMCLIL